jgi:hypothetical protein
MARSTVLRATPSPMTVSPQDASAPPPAAPGAESVMMLKRDGAPPLKLRAAPAARYVGRRGAAIAEIALLARTVGWAVAVTVRSAEPPAREADLPARPALRPRADARCCETLDEAAAWVREVAERRYAPASVDRGPAVEVAAARLIARMRATQAEQALAIAAGAALSDWTDPQALARLCGAPASDAPN